MNLSKLQKGDQVTQHYRLNSKIATITKTTKKYIFIGHKKYNKETGSIAPFSWIESITPLNF